MMPGMNPRQMQQMMRQMGIQQVEVPASQVIILTDTKRIVIDNPQVSKVSMMGQQTWQVVGASREEPLDVSPDIDEEDIRTVMEQAGVDKESAANAITAAKGDLAKAIMDLQK